MQKKLSSRKFYVNEYAERRCMEDYAKEQLELGEQRGANNKTMELARNMLKENISTDIVSKVTGLSKKMLMTML